MAETVEAPLVRVELFEDRAAVTRRVPLPTAGRHVLRIGPLSPLVTERGLSFPGVAGVLVEEVRVDRVRSLRVDADPAHLAALEHEVRSAHQRVTAAADRLRRCDEQVARLRAGMQAALGAAPRAMIEGHEPQRWVDALERLGRALRPAREQRAGLAVQLEQAERDHRRARSLLDAGRAGRPVVHGWLELSVVAQEPGELRLRYVVPCALWRPAHRAVLRTRDRGAPADRLEWELRAVCWNATGEDWSGAELSCSTARPGDLASPPRLVDDPIEVRRRDTQVVVEARDEAVQVARERGAKAAAEVPGVDDGGEPRTFTARGPVHLPSDGQPVTVPLDVWAAETAVTWQAFPERSAAVVLRTLARNGGSRPLLAGPVELVRDGEAVGRGQVALVPPGEPFALGWGSHDGLRLRRKADHTVDRAMITGRQKHAFDVEIQLAHQGHAAVKLEVRERIPTSELKEVTVSGATAEPALDAPPDADGFCRWTVHLQPGETRTLRLRYGVDAASNVTLPFQPAGC